MSRINLFEWSNKGSDYTIVMVGTQDDFKIRGIRNDELKQFCREYNFSGMIRSLPLFSKKQPCEMCFNYGKGLS